MCDLAHPGPEGATTSELFLAELPPDAPADLVVPEDLDLLDQLLSLGLPVADPPEKHRLNLERWSAGEGQRDLLALSADPRFKAAFVHGANGFGNDGDGLRTISMLIDSPGGRPMLTDWVRLVAHRFSAAGLPKLPEAMQRLSWLPDKPAPLHGRSRRCLLLSHLDLRGTAQLAAPSALN